MAIALVITPSLYVNSAKASRLTNPPDYEPLERGAHEHTLGLEERVTRMAQPH